jgi:hypothetical protein
MAQLNINGSIGYTLLSNKDIKILVLADMHSKLPYCDKDGIFVSDWFLKKFNSKILLEEVPRIGTQLKELWPSSPHTQKLKEAYLKNSSVIQGIDIRPFLIPFSWELSFDNKIPNIHLKNYLSYINLFCNLKLDLLRNELKNIYTKEYLSKSLLGLHYLKIKRLIKKYVDKNKKFLDIKIKDLAKNNTIVLEKVNEIISCIMEWYIVAKIYQSLLNGKKNIIIHAGLVHTTNLILLLQKIYNFKIVSEEGLTNIDNYDNPNNGCLHLPVDIDKQFGGKYMTNLYGGFLNN